MKNLSHQIPGELKIWENTLSNSFL
jgi:hypothetical protein